MERGENGTPTRTRELLERWLAGDGAAERRLFERHRAALVMRAKGQRRIRGLARHASVEDLVDEVFVRALASGALRAFECRGAGSLERFLASLLDSVVADALRRQGRQKRGDGRPDLSLEWSACGGPGLGPLLATDTSPTERARVDETIELCRKVLSEPEWEVFRLRELEGHTSAEVARRVGRSDAGVRSVLHRARKKILRALAGCNGESGSASPA